MDNNERHVLSGDCPTKNCENRMFFLSETASIECKKCGRYYRTDELSSIQSLNKGLQKFAPNMFNEIYDLLKLANDGRFHSGDKDEEAHAERVQTERKPFPQHASVSQYQCKALSYFLTNYGMESATGRAKRLKEMGKPPIFDCSVLADRAFSIENDSMDEISYGWDRCGSSEYLADVLLAINKFNNNIENLVPIHADPDGHCLVHALSRALVGYQLFCIRYASISNFIFENI